MCFSASASFGAGIILTSFGVVTIKKVRNPSQLFFASIPFIFGIQQFSEGFLWLALTFPKYAFLEQICTYSFLFFAQIVWPILIPVSIFFLEKKGKKESLQILLIMIGAIVSLYLGFCLLSYPVQAKILGQHISYKQDYPIELRQYGGIFYFLATIFPPLFSGLKKVWVLSLAIFISYLITYIFYDDYIISVWCFFASILSGLIFYLLSTVQATSEEKTFIKIAK
jgi:hypothetical protein